MMPGELEACARRVYELHRKRDVRKSRVAVATWDQLYELTRSRLIAEFWRVRVTYDLGRRAPREVAITS